MRDIVVKICGVTNKADAEAAVAYGAQLIGLIFVPTSPRCVSDSAAQEISEAVAGRCKLVGVFQDQDLDFVNGKRQALKLDLVQLHGFESEEYTAGARPCMKVIKGYQPKLQDRFSSCADYLLFDRYKNARNPLWLPSVAKILSVMPTPIPFLLAGGITPDNVRQIVTGLVANQSFFGIDVASGVESAPGVKDHLKIRLLMDIVTEVSRNAVAG